MSDSAPQVGVVRAYAAWFSGPESRSTLGLSTLLMLIPVVGPIMLQGYGIVVIASIARRPHAPFPPVDPNHLLDYLRKGIGPFLVQLALSLALIPAIATLAVVSVVLVPLLGLDDSGVGGAVAAGIGLLMLLGGAVLIALLSALSAPLSLRSGVTEDVAKGFDVGYMRDFVRRTWRELFGAYLVITLSLPFLFGAGVMMCFVGILPAMALYTLAELHLKAQLYRLYLHRGGQADAEASTAAAG